MTIQQALDQKRLELERIERDMSSISPQTFAYQKLPSQYDALTEQIHTLEAQREHERRV
jgi:hypothetical protein